MRTEYWTVQPVYDPELPAIREAAQMLRSGKLVAFPTETVYGLGADARSTEAVEGIFAAKGRPSDNPLIVHIAKLSQLDDLIDRPDETCLRLFPLFWPGPLTVVMPVKPGAVSPRVTAGLSTVGVRMPDHPVALGLIRAAGCPIAAPSANRSGRPSPTRAEHVRDDLDGRIDGLVDGGPTGIGVESTVVEVRAGVVHVLRPGGITPEQLRAAGFRVDTAGAVTEWKEQEDTPRSPGMKYTHYAPRGVMTVVEGDEPERVAARMQAELNAAKRDGRTTGVLTYEEHAARFDADVVLAVARRDEPGRLAHELYAALRRFDDAGVEVIFAEGCPEAGLGLAVMNRMRKAAGNRVIRV